MKNKTYYVEMFGNYSNDFGWDDGLSVSSVTEVNDDDILEWNNSVSDNTDFYQTIPSDWAEKDNGSTQWIFANEHGGSRDVSLLIAATNANRAARYARVWANRYYPEE